MFSRRSADLAFADTPSRSATSGGGCTRVYDIDFVRRRIDVDRAFSDVGGRIVLGTPKSHQSR
jgi:hypothetical protein